MTGRGPGEGATDGNFGVPTAEDKGEQALSAFTEDLCEVTPDARGGEWGDAVGLFVDQVLPGTGEGAFVLLRFVPAAEASSAAASPQAGSASMLGDSSVATTSGDPHGSVAFVSGSGGVESVAIIGDAATKSAGGVGRLPQASCSAASASTIWRA